MAAESQNNGFRYYQGAGDGSAPERLDIGGFERDERLVSAAYYQADEGLRDAVNVAIMLGQPLLVTGEPGTGKTQLAYSIHHELKLAGPFIFHTKTTSTASDIFYAYDAMRHFQDSQVNDGKRPISDYITFHALGLAILSAGDPARSNQYLRESEKIAAPMRSLVLIDEIDKAPRDLPNDVLDEIDNMRFRVPELDQVFEAQAAFRPIVILTSNSEKDLPEPFLRRCIYYHIPFPGKERLRRIVEQRLPTAGFYTPQRIEAALDHFRLLRESAKKKPPATAELLAWMDTLRQLEVDVDNLKPGQRELLALSYSALFKNKEDLNRARQQAIEG